MTQEHTFPASELRSIVEASAYSYAELAALLGTSRDSLFWWAHGKRAPVGASATLVRLLLREERKKAGAFVATLEALAREEGRLVRKDAPVPKPKEREAPHIKATKKSVAELLKAYKASPGERHA